MSASRGMCGPQKEYDLLVRSENAWKPSKLEEDERQTVKIFRKVRGILNKMTPQKFQPLLQKVQALEINTEARLRGVVDLIFEKAINEPSFCEPYANMCHMMSQFRVSLETGSGSNTFEFRKILLTRCQREFENRTNEEELNAMKVKIENTEKPEVKQQLNDALELETMKQRRRMLGNIRLIGELFKLNMITESVMHNCIMSLFRACDEDSLECLCQLLNTIGKRLDNVKKKTRMDQYFEQMNKIVREKKTTSRVRFILMDVIDLRLNNWVQIAIKSQGPKTIKQIYADAKKEKEQIALKAAAASAAKASTMNQSTSRGMSGPQRCGGYQHQHQSPPSQPKVVKKKVSIQREDDPLVRSENGWKPSRLEPKATDLSKYEQQTVCFYSGSHTRNRSKVIIRDPNTLADVTSDVLQQPGGSSATPTLPGQTVHNSDQQIVAQFAAQVAAAATGSPERSPSPPTHVSMSTAPVRASPVHFYPPSPQNNCVQRAIKSQGPKTIEQWRENNSHYNTGVLFHTPRVSLPHYPVQSSREATKCGSGGSMGPPAAAYSRGRDERKAVDTARKLTSQEDKKRGSSPSVKSSPRSRATFTPIPQMDETFLVKKVDHIIKKYLYLVDLKEAIECILELKVPPNLTHLIVSSSMESSLEKKQSDRKHVANLICDIIKQRIVTEDEFLKGAALNIELAADLELDLPKVWTCMAELVAPVIYDPETGINLSHLVPMSQQLLELDRSVIFVTEILKKMVSLMPAEGVLKQWVDHNLQWSSFTQSTDTSQLNEMLSKNNLSMFGGTSNGTQVSPVNQTSHKDFSTSVSEITRHLDKLQSDDTMFDWLEATFNFKEQNESQFVRALTTAICMKAIVEKGGAMEVDKEVIKSRTLVFKKFVDTEDKELEAVYALQKLYSDLEQPPNILKLLFDLIYDEEIISEQTFLKWEKTDNPVESEGGLP